MRQRITRHRGLMALLLLLAWLPTVALAVPFWGDRYSSPVDTPLDQLAPGAWIWGGDDRRAGPMAVVVSLTEQRAYVYRNGILVGVTTISSGREGYETPTGVFSVLQKDADHRSNLYGNAPMPYQQRLTWDGIALHAGGLPGYPESHGCVHLPSEFARLLFEASTLGMTVVVAEEGQAPVSRVHPGPLSPIDLHTGDDVDVPRLADGSHWRWTPSAADSGPISMVLSRSDRLLVVYRDGKEIGRTRLELKQPGAMTGTRAYIVAAGFRPPAEDTVVNGYEDTIEMPSWIAIGVPGAEHTAGERLPDTLVNQVVIPDAFKARVLPLLAPGTVLVATDAHLNGGNGGEPLRIIDSVGPRTWLDDIVTEIHRDPASTP
ncbi:L,D-transpeptidase [Salinicola avicenniae]|uniref:L,D-transpeptidase n=1 Tax=Salinicola avicenniae TaxID=2916836 RepID=UPI00207345C2|nr:MULTISPECIES: L,D-transpeptidase [unclassified Salinicola]